MSAQPLETPLLSKAAAAIRIAGVQKRFETPGRAVIALKDIDLDIASGEFVCLLGPSGCGKSTLLNAIAGFSPPSAGTITVDGKLVKGPGPDRGMVFQEYALFPWMTVEANVGFGLEIKGTPKAQRHERASRKTCRAACASASRSPACSRSTRRSC
jgi:NitT/TauT family transport system ATP-binding protein